MTSKPAKPRSSTREDLAEITRLSDGLPNIDAVCISVKNVTESNLFGEIRRIRLHDGKHHQTARIPV
jgi:hypothetical protein